MAIDLRADPRTVLATARESLECYCIALFPAFQSATHHRLMIGKLEDVERGKIRRLIVAEPPRHGKSLLTSQLFPAWYLGKHPDRSVICATYGQDLSDDFGRKVRNTLSDPLHTAIFPASRLSNDSAAQRRFDLTSGGSYYAVGRGGPITGRGATLLVIDDPLKDREEAYSQTIRRGLRDWYRTVAYTRLQPDAAVVIIATRWHEDDLSGWLLAEHPEEGWELLSLPAIAEVDESFRNTGEPLWPARYPLPVLESIRAAIGGAAWSSLYQQRPAAAEGAVFKRGWFLTYREQPASFQKIIQSWDTAYKTGADNDYSVCTTWGVTQGGYYLLAMWRGKVEFPELKRQFANQADTWKPHVVLVEDRASGQSLTQEFKLATRFPVLSVKVDSDKLTRAEAITPLFEGGKVFLPESAPWLNDYMDELSTFPAGQHDDQVDSTSQALNHLRAKSAGGFLSWLQSSHDKLAAEDAAREAQNGGLVAPVPATAVAVRPATDHFGNVLKANQIAAAAKPQFSFSDPFGVLRRPPKGGSWDRG